MPSLQVLQDIDSVAIGQIDVEQREIQVVPARNVQRLTGVCCLDDLVLWETLGEQVAQASPHEFVIISYKYPGHGWAGGLFAFSVRGSRSVTHVPRGTTGATEALPPSARARSAIPNKPSERGSPMASSGIPLPLSSTLSKICPSRGWRLTFTIVALACRATFVSAS